VLRRLLRAPLRLIPKSAIVPIVSGPARGYRWRVGASDHGCWIGWYESNVWRAVREYLHDVTVAYDLGANVGYTALVLSRFATHVYAVEPSADELRHTVALNGLGARITVLDAAVSSRSGTARFAGERSTAHLDVDGARTVRTVALDDLDWPDPQFVKMDIEGHEADALRGMRTRLARSRPTLLIATHNDVARADTLAELARYGYAIEWLTPDTLLAHS